MQHSLTMSPCRTVCSSVFCALQSLLRKVTKDDSLVIAEMVMKMMLTMLNSSVGKTGGVQDDAISTVGVVIQGGLGLLMSFKVGRTHNVGYGCSGWVEPMNVGVVTQVDVTLRH